ncbi:MAG: Smr/MutS family protein [Pseudazoarcus pumilus]|nr:Smr/MutS family protein [Pseudazoarcus pumilus]
MTRRKDSGLDTLKSVRARIVSRRPAVTPQTPPRSAAKAPPAETDDIDLFRREMRGVAPIDDGNRAELDTPRPAPVPRPRQPEAEPDAPSRDERHTEHLGERELFRASMQGVVPLADNNRVELSGPRAHAARGRLKRAADPLAKPDVDDVPPLLPADPEQMDAAQLFRHAMRGAAPIPDRNRIEPERPQPRPEPIKRSEDEASALRETMEAPISLEDRLEMGDEAVFLRPGMPRRALLDLRRGRWTLQGELDLHGYTREDARLALSRFLAASLQRGARCVRVIHGKGLGSPGGVSILKQLSRGWLAQREEILAFCQAGPTQGGSGALLVLLRGSAAPRNEP